MADQVELIRQAGERYEREYDRYSKLTNLVAEICRTEIVEANAIRANVTYRTKSPTRFKGKLERLLAKPEEAASLTTVDAVFDRVGDLSGVRVLTYEERDRERVVELIKSRFDKDGAVNTQIDRKDRVNPDDAKFYRATHCDVRLGNNDLAAPNENLQGVPCEIQVCSMLAHVWNEIEHDLVYKPLTGRISDAERDALKTLGHLTIAADIAIKQLYESTTRRQKDETGEFEDVHDFVTRIRDLFPDAENFANNSLQLYEELLAMDLRSPDRLEPLMTEENRGRSAALLNKFNEVMKAHGEGHFLEPGSSDVLLVLLLGPQAQQIVENHPAGRGQGRPPRIRSLAHRYDQYRGEIEGT